MNVVKLSDFVAEYKFIDMNFDSRKKTGNKENHQKRNTLYDFKTKKIIHFKITKSEPNEISITMKAVNEAHKKKPHLNNITAS